VNHVPIEQVTKEMRYAAKTVNFGVLYGQGPRALAEQTGMTLPEAKDFIRKYFETFSAVREYIEETKQLAHELGYVETLTGRRRMIPELHSTMPMLRASGERMAVNTPIQGTAADMIKIAMIRIAHRLHSARTSAHVRAHDAHMLLQVHDELVLEVRESSVKHIAKMVREEMESAMKLRVPIKVDAKFGNNWSEMKPV
ncbi:MAG TPA: DNA polymerase, partial [Patescibacteria group bacterium]|nr:DNA polymerase [Patescibacteria group bacterium]